ncbi:MAG TPA: HNH endonuclease, partial [archaeon]|nr:HNH endonuclease [archaeon]
WFDGKDIAFDFSRLRPAGARLNTMGGRSSGPGVLRDLLAFARTKILSRQGKRLRNIDVHDVICKIGEVVVMGGVRRTALISLSDLDDEEMRHAKTGQFYLTEPQRSMANNSAVYLEKPSATTFLDEWLALAKSGTGERGIFNRGGLRHQLPERRWKLMGPHAATTGTNPCVTGETLVPVADGRGNVPIRDLAARGRDVPVFTLNGRGKVTVRMMRNPRLTEKNAPIYKVTLDDGSAVRATANHKFRLKSGEYKQVDELIPGDSLALLTRYRASIKDIFPDANSRSQDYWWLTTGAATNAAEHRLIAAFHQNVAVPTGMVVHHKDRNALNNSPENLEILTKEAHDALHANLMLGDANPMRRAHEEWSSDQWAAYRQKHSANNAGASNKRFSGFTDEQLRSHALALTKALGHRFSQKDWAAYAKAHGLPQSFSKWRRDHLGGILGLAKWAALELGYEHVDADPRVLESFKKYASLGYDCDIREGELIIHKRCEVCGSPFDADKARREYGVCSISCGLKRAWSAPGATAALSRRLREAHAARKAGIREAQTKIYSDLKFQLSREPTKKEWAAACRAQKLSAEIARDSSPFRAYGDLQEAAATYNHKVASVEFTGYEDVYNGTVDEFHNFFVGGFASQTRNGKPKLAYLNNLQCGEIILRSKSFCNLSEVVARKEDTEASLLRKVRLATIIGTYQSMLTNFPYLSREWKENCEEERLLGVSLTGQWDSPAARNPETLR